MKNLFPKIRNMFDMFKSKKVLIPVTAFLVVVFLLLWLAGTFSSKIDYKNIEASTVQPYSGKTAKVSLITVPLTETASGTVQAIRETTITSKLTARVIEVCVKAGEIVKKGQLIIKLDDTELQGKLQQGKADIALSEANIKQAESDYTRYSGLYETRAVSRQEFENVATRLKNTKSELLKANGMVNEVESLIRYANIVSPIDGLVVDKEVDVGDTVLPGQVLMKLYDNTAMQLVANVRESLANKLTPGQDIGVKIDSLDKICTGKVYEIVPEANSTDRTFQVKVTGPCPKGIYSGMFGRIYIPLGKEEVLVIPKTAVINAGQLELVNVIENGTLAKCYIRTGRTFDNNVEVLSGLKDGETVALNQIN
ncbi:MAG TPA: hypothetical protein DD381_05325 [Lentisphaeria bacterium]|nr:MAG: hypothetical protein A2X47_01595 [Lentisphaerae bacterium GWF2_38_69]HBM15751.1 hypothetical protein [Lentisphaeria bacterium]